MREVVEELIRVQKTISTMESCTGGGIANAITNVEGASSVISFSAVTYSNEFKIKMGVNKDTIDKHSVYSMEVAREMSKNICAFSNSDYGIGITGQINRIDQANIVDNSNKIYISIYDRKLNKYYEKILISLEMSRSDNKEYIINEISKVMISALKTKI